MKGEIVKQAIKAAGYTQAQMADLIDVTREHLQRMLASEISDAYVQKIRDKGVVIQNVTSNVTESDITGPGKEEWNRVLSLFERTFDLVEQNIKTIEKNNGVLTSIVQLGLDEGMIRIDKSPNKLAIKKH